uniref:ChrR-like cupin domain-containing protein n=1 Tax=Chromera velia CCMP2878 TaxID=1169474 RepID=A0A0G4F9B4_9ALVE|eukprot:Cvel_15869.t1-p1 / transcript=Cvel_15869.t1 / gene=Cvel_15869 / organism=Chromera_velia_CCMP2878 / gene_product=hypothetical protein / transcript_product=hypothetical protein / location=Cvel_scaffold1197:618-1397(-) / protein_length=260 / sequence_SO=supercontig / SO=protein_coding / is_pseudo=false
MSSSSPAAEVEKNGTAVEAPKSPAPPAADEGDEYGLNFHNADSVVIVDPEKLEWRSSGPAAKVERKRFFRNGPWESGRVTSLVRYRPNASFPLHPHPEGEEILVLDGVFKDLRGDHTSGTFLLNPEGFEHQPSTDEGGNLIFVRLRQYPGSSRPQKAIQTAELPWDSEGKKILYAAGEGGTDTQFLWKVPASALLAPVEGGREIFVVNGSFVSEFGNHPIRSWIRLPSDTGLRVEGASEDAVALVREGAEACWRLPFQSL